MAGAAGAGDRHPGGAVAADAEDRRHLTWIIASAGIPGAETCAAGLIDEFGDAGTALQGSRRRQVRAASGNREVPEALARFRDAMLHVLRPRPSGRPALSDWPRLRAYVRARLAFDRIERFCALYLDAGGRLISEDLVADGTVDRAVVHVREVLARAIDVGAASMVIVHNHPGGSASPSPADIELTARLQELAASFDLTLIDHLIVTTETTFSFRRAGLLA